MAAPELPPSSSPLPARPSSPGSCLGAGAGPFRRITICASANEDQADPDAAVGLPL